MMGMTANLDRDLVGNGSDNNSAEGNGSGWKYPTFEEYLKHEHHGPYTATDIIIRHDDSRKKGVVLIDRKYFPIGLAFPGGMAEHMTWSENAVKEAKEETGLDVMLDDPERPMCALSGINDDPRAHIATIVYTARGYGKLCPDPKEDAKSATIVTNDELYDLTLDKNAGRWAMARHRHIAQLYLEYIGYDIKRCRT